MSSEAHVEDAAAADGGAASFPETVAAAAGGGGGGCLLLAVVRRAAVLLGRLRVRRRWRDVRRRRRAVGLLARRWVARLVAHDRWVASVDQISCKNSNELAVCAAATACVDAGMDIFVCQTGNGKDQTRSTSQVRIHASTALSFPPFMFSVFTRRQHMAHVSGHSGHRYKPC